MSDVQISVRIPKEHAEALQARADAEDRTFSAELRRAIRAYLRRQPVPTSTDGREHR